jgi:hypothetical protein
MKTLKLISALSFCLLIFSCTKDDIIPAITAEDASASTKIDIANDDVSSVIEEQEAYTYAVENNSQAVASKTVEIGKMALSNSNISSCATVTRIPAFGTPIISGTQITKTIDFGSAGCLINNGNTLKGKIIVSYVYEPEAVSHSLTYTFDNFYHNDTKLEGTKTLIRTMTVATTNSPSHPIVTMNIDLTATFANGDVYKRTGQKVREIIQGYNTPLILLDNVYNVTGDWATILPNGKTQNAAITTALEIKLSCIETSKPLIVKGVILYERNGKTATLDFGDGICDNVATFTSNGVSKEITIGK